MEIGIEFSEKRISTPERGSQEPGCPPRDIIRVPRSGWQVELNRVLTSRILSFKLGERRLGPELTVVIVLFLLHHTASLRLSTRAMRRLVL